MLSKKTFIVWLLLSSHVLSEELTIDDELSLDLEGDEELLIEGIDPSTATKPEPNASITASPFSFSLSHGISVRPASNLDNIELVNHRSNISINAEDQIYPKLFAKVNFSGNVYWPQDHRAESNMNQKVDYYGRIVEAWIQRSWDNFNIKFGLQNLNWNEVEGAYTTGNFNTIDNRELLFVEFKEATLAQSIALMQYYSKPIVWDLFVNLLPGFNKNPSSNSKYYLTNNFEHLPIDTVQSPSPEFGLRSKFNIGLTELSIQFSRLSPNQPAIKIMNATFDNGDPIPSGGTIIETADEFYLLALNFNHAFAQNLIKTDVSFKNNQAINNDNFGLVQKNVSDLAVGVEKTWKQHLFTASVSYSSILDWDRTLLMPRTSGLLSFSWMKNYLNDDLAINAFVGSIIKQSTRFGSLSLNYTVDDNWRIETSAFVFYITDNTDLFYPFRNENRMNAKIILQF